jgi:hypothetical protein
VKHFSALHLFKEVQRKDFVFMQFMYLLIAAPPTVLGTEFLSPEPEGGSMLLFPHSYTPSLSGEWIQILFYCFKNCLTAEIKTPHFKTLHGKQNL